MGEFYPGRLLPNFYEQRRHNVVFAISMMLCLVIAYAGVHSFDELVGLSLLAAACSMLLGSDRKIHLRPWHYVVFALSGVLLFAGMANSAFGDENYKYYFLEGVFIFDKAVPHTPGGYGLGVAISYAGIWWLTIALSGRRYTTDEIRTFQNYYMYFITLLAIVLVASNLDWNWFGERRGNVNFLFWKEENGLNANALVYFSLPVIVVGLARILVKWDWQTFCMVAVNLAVLACCRTRGALVGLAISVVALFVYFVCIAPYRKKLLLAGGIALVSVAGVMIVLWIAAPERMNELMRTLFRIGSGSSGRTEMWKEAVSYLEGVRDWLLGRGWTEFYLHGFSPTYHVGLHNMYLEYFYSAGIVAAVLVGVVWTMFFVKTHDWFVVALMGGPIMHTLVENGDIPVGFAFMILCMSLLEQMREGNGKSKYFIYYFLDTKQQEVFHEWVSPADSAFTALTCEHSGIRR